MFKFVDYSDISLLLEEVSQNESAEFLDILTSYLDHTNKIFRKESLQNITDLEQFVSVDSLFGESQPNVIDLQYIKLGISDIEFISKLSNQSLNDDVIFVDTANNSLSAEVKKSWQKVGLGYAELKPPSLEKKLDLGYKYSKKINLALSDNLVNDIAKSANSYFEVVNSLDLASLSTDPNLILESSFSKEKLPLFMLGFDTNDVSKSIVNWYKNVTEEDVQLALSLIYGKLDKSKNPKTNQLKKILINTDLDIKSNTKLSMIYRFRLFLWKAANL